jgi:hypothetical protein
MTNARKEACKTEYFYQSIFTPKTQKLIHYFEVLIGQRKNAIIEEQIKAEFAIWVEDPRFSRTRDTKLYKKTDLLCIVKFFIARAIEDRATSQ